MSWMLYKEIPLAELATAMSKVPGTLIALQRKPGAGEIDRLSTLMQRSLQELLLERVAAGRTVFFSSHLISEVERICSRVAIVRGGRLVALMTRPSFQELELHAGDNAVASFKPTALHVIKRK